MVQKRSETFQNQLLSGEITFQVNFYIFVMLLGIGVPMKRIILHLLCIVILAMFIMPTTSASGFDEYEDGDEEEILGHSFDDEYFTSSVSNETENGTVTFSVSYVNSNDVQVFLVALEEVEGKNGEKGTLPYQLFGMHYFTPKGREVFIGAVFAFLMAYNDTTGNNIQDPGNEDVFYIIPYGLGDTNGSYVPTTTVHEVQKLGDGHYRFGITYENLFAKIVNGNNPLGFWISLALPIYHARFSELTVMYDVTIDEDSGELKAEAFYTIGQVGIIRFLGIPVDPSDVLTEDWGISAVHYVSVFASWYQFTSAEDGHEINTGITAPAENISIKVGDKDDRAFDIGYRGTYDLLDESTTPHTTIEENKNAYNILLQAKLSDLILIGWQLGFSGGLFSLMSYALSDKIQEEYDSPADLRQRWWLNYANSAKLWYAVSFPNWQGYRVEHDPTYTAYFGDGTGDVTEDDGACASGALILVGAVFVPSASVVSKKRKGSKKD
jgi:hypothetical protein